jgi:hypothetical protein
MQTREVRLAVTIVMRACLLLLCPVLFLGAAAAQTPPSWPITGGRQQQPSQQQIDTRRDDKLRAWDRRVQPDIDRLYDELTRDTPGAKRSLPR